MGALKTTYYRIAPNLAVAVSPGDVELVNSEGGRVEARIAVDVYPVARNSPKDDWYRIEWDGILPDDENPNDWPDP